MVRTVQLDENKHAVAMLRGLKQSQHEREHCDFIVKVQDQNFHAHKIVLSLGSPYFKAMLKHDTKEIQEGVVEMKGVDFECVKTCIDFMYTARFDIPDGKISDLLHVAIMMQLDELKEAICEILRKSLTAENFYEMRNVAEMYNLQIIVEACRKYYDANFIRISEQPGFKDERKSHVIKNLKTKKLSNEQKLSVSLRWVGESTDRVKNITELMKLIKLKEVSTEYLSNLLENHPVISNDLRLYKLISAPVVERAKKEIRDYEKQIILFESQTMSLKSYNPAANKVTMFCDVEFKRRHNLNMVCMDPFIYVLCPDKSVFRLNFKDRKSKWERMSDMTADHGPRPPSVSTGRSLFVIGDSSRSVTKVVEKFDPDVNQWLRLEDKPEAVSGASLVSLEDSIYCIGGHTKSSSGRSLCQFSTSTLKWVDLEPMLIARIDCASVVVHQTIFVMGGWSGENLSTLECYDILSGQWSSLAPMIAGHGNFNAHYFDGCIFVVDGKEIEKYNIANNNWQRINVETSAQFKANVSITIPCG